MVTVKPDALARAHRLWREHSWRDACAEFAEAQQATELAAADLEAWAIASYLTGHLDTAAAVWTKAHRAFLDSGEHRRALRCAFWQGMTLVQRGDRARGGAWLARAGRLLDQCPDGPEHAYLRTLAGIQALDSGDASAALSVFEEATGVGERTGDLDLATLGRLGQGQALVDLGEAGRGLAMFDETMLTVTNNEVSPIVAGIVYCAVIIYCQRVFDVRRAQQWTSALSDWCATQQDIKPYRGQCLVHRSQLFQLRGHWSEAMTEVRHACEHLAEPPGDPVQGMAFYQLGELLRLRGEFEAAEDAYRRANQWGHSVQPGMALLRLAQGRVDDALAALCRVLDQIQAPAQRVPCLAASIEVALAARKTATARTALDELVQITGQFDSPYLSAICEHARGTVSLSESDAGVAMIALQSAKRAWHELVAPYEAARAAMHLGVAYERLGDRDSARLEWDTARRQFEEAEAVTDLARLSQLSGAATPDLAGLTEREAQILAHVAAGMTNRQIADALAISEHTVRRHLQNMFAKLDLPSRAAATAWAYQHKLLPASPD